MEPGSGGYTQSNDGGVDGYSVEEVMVVVEVKGMPVMKVIPVMLVMKRMMVAMVMTEIIQVKPRI